MRTFGAKGEPLRHYTDGFCGWAIVSEAGRIRYEMIETVRDLERELESGHQRTGTSETTTRE